MLDALGLAALAGLIFFCLWLGEFRPFLYRGGFALVALTSALLIAVIVHPRARLCAGLLRLKPLRWVGLRSYGIYLWHWPVFMVTRPQLDVPLEGLDLLAVRLSATVVLAELSYRLLETPIRRGALGQAWRALREARGARRWGLGAGWAAGVGAGIASCVVLGVAVAQARAPEPPSYLSKMSVHAESPVAASEPAKTAEKNDSANTRAASPTAPEDEFVAGKEDTAPASIGANEREAQSEASETTTASAAPASTDVVTAIGDSVMIGGVEELQQEIPNLALVDAQGSRQAPAAISILRQWREKGKLGDMVVVHIGNNGVLTDEQFDEMMGVLADVRAVLIVNTTVPDGYQWVPNNAVLADGVGRYPEKAVLVDWHAESTGHPEYFWDGLHLTPQGQRAYTYLIAAHLEGGP